MAADEHKEEVVCNIEASIGELRLDGDITDIPKWLQDVESPFNWLQVRFPDVPSKEIIPKVTEKIEMDQGLEHSFPFEKFVCLLTLVFELSCEGEDSAAWKYFKQCQDLLESEKIKVGKTYSNLSEALNHALQATKAHILLRSGKKSEAKQVVASLVPMTAMTVHELAAMKGLRAQFFHHYRGEGARLALQYARHALALVPDSPLWLLLTSRSIRRLRKFQPSTEEVSSEEVELLQRAVNIDRSVRNVLLLAQAYREAGDCCFQKHRNEEDFFHSQTFHKISDMQEKAFKLYIEALSLRPDSEVVNRLCGYGLLKLPAFKSDYRLAEGCLQRALELDPTNSTTIHALGLHYYKGHMDYEKAALFCEKAGKLGNFPASLDMLRMKRLVYGANYDPVFDFKKLLQQYGHDKTKKHEILCQMGSYYLFFERNLSKALVSFKTLITENADHSIMTSHKCTFLNMGYKINLFHYVVNESLKLLQQNTEQNCEKGEESLKDIKSFLNDLQSTNPELFGVSIKESLIDDLHKVSDGIKQTYIRKKERRDNAKERRRSSLTSRRGSLEETISVTNLRRQSDSSINFRRRGSDNMESLQNRSYKNLNNRVPNQPLKTNIVDKDTNRQKINDSNSNSVSSFRRRSSGAISVLRKNCQIRSSYSPAENTLINKDSQVWETIREISHEPGKPLQRRNSEETATSLASQNRPAGKLNAKSHYKRNVSWSGSVTQAKQTNWRVKIDKE